MKKHLLFLFIIFFFKCTDPNLTFHEGSNPSSGTIELVQTFGGSKNDVAKICCFNS